MPLPAPVGRHPAVIISAPGILANADFKLVNVLPVTSIKAGTGLRPTQVALNGADGLDYLSGVNCTYIYLLEKRFIEAPRGLVTLARRREIINKLHELHQWPWR
jgi:mRNA-degrading endonuclease toxin of MazEF toxin-antitoxin module